MNRTVRARRWEWSSVRPLRRRFRKLRLSRHRLIYVRTAATRHLWEWKAARPATRAALRRVSVCENGRPSALSTFRLFGVLAPGTCPGFGFVSVDSRRAAESEFRL